MTSYKTIFVNGVQMLYHRYVVEQHIGRKLQANEHIHHVNGDRLDNRIENLQIVSPSEHARIEGSNISEETREKMRISHTGKHLSAESIEKLSKAHRGRSVSQDARGKISKALMGHKPSDETRAKLSGSRAGRKPFLGHKHTPESRQKMSEKVRASWDARRSAKQSSD